MPRKSVLSSKPTTYRGGIARGLKAGEKEKLPVDPKGGDYGAGVIRGMAIITRGEALGHGVWIDEEMLSSVADSINATSGGAKARFTHPDLSGDGLGKFTGRVKNAFVDGDVTRGDLHFSKTSHQTPDGDLAGYLMQLAQDDPEAFGNSIAFEPDFDAEELFVLEHGGWDEFESPDPLNEKNLAHARMKELRAVDAVDEPAANPTGLFHRGQELIEEADALLSWTLGLSSQRPTLKSLDVDADRVGGFVQRFLDRHNLALTSKEHPMPNGKLNAAAETETKPANETNPAETAPAAEAPKEETKPAEAPKVEEKPAAEAKPAETQAATGEGGKFLSAFGDKGGVWFAQGKTFAEAQELYVADLKATNAKLSADNAELSKQVQLLKGEAKPVSFQAADEPKPAEAKSDLASGLSPSQAKFAQAIRVPGQN